MVTFSAGCDSERFVHGYECEKANHDGYTKEEIAIRVDEYEAGLVRFRFAQEDLGEEVEQGVAQEAADGEGDHY